MFTEIDQVKFVATLLCFEFNIVTIVQFFVATVSIAKIYWISSLKIRIANTKGDTQSRLQRSKTLPKIQTNKETCIHTITHTDTHNRHSYRYTQTHINKHKTHTKSQTYTWTNTHTHTHKQTLTHTYAQTHMHTQANVHTGSLHNTII